MPTKSPASLQEFLRDATFPLAKDELVRRAREAALTPEILGMLERLPRETYMTPVDVSLAVSELDAGSTSGAKSGAAKGAGASRRSTTKAEPAMSARERS